MLRKIIFLGLICLGGKSLVATDYFLAFTINPATGETMRVTGTSGTTYNGGTGAWSFNGSVQMTPSCMDFTGFDLPEQKYSCVGTHQVGVNYNGTTYNSPISDNLCGPPEKPLNVTTVLSCMNANFFLCQASFHRNGLNTYDNWDCYFAAPLLPEDKVTFIIIDWVVVQSML
jgi:hypothetical protein